MTVQTLNNTEVIKPCPFCGKEVIIMSIRQTREYLIIHKGLRNCPFYQFKMPWEVAKSLEEATELWNRRAERSEDDNN